MTVLGCYKLNIKNGNINAILNISYHLFCNSIIFDCNFFYFLDYIRSMVGSIILTISLRLMQAKETLHK